MDALKGNITSIKTSGEDDQFEKDAAIKASSKTLQAFSGV